MNFMQSVKSGLVREAEGFEGTEYAVVSALIVAAALAATVALGVALNGDVASFSQVIHL